MSERSQEYPLVTVVVPCYKLAHTVERTIQSVYDQKYPGNIELVVVNDGSPDDTESVVLRAFTDKPANVSAQYIRQDNAGVAIARNRGVYSGHGKYVCCIDADDAIAPDYLRVCVDALEEDRTLAIAYTGLWFIKPNGEEGLSPWPTEWDYDKQLSGLNQIPTCNVSRRDMWLRLGGQRQRYAPRGAGEEDAEMWLRAGAYGFKARKVTDAGLFLYSWLSGRVSGNKSHKMTNYRVWHPWVKDKQYPFASYASPERFSHPVRQYDEPTISVIIPVGKGHESTVMTVLDSLEAQTLRNWEAIVVHDGTQCSFEWDDTPQRHKNFRTAYPYVRFVDTGSNEGRGAGVARNVGAKHARADLLLFVDADDWLDPQALELMLKAYTSEGSIIYTDYVGQSFMTKENAEKYGDRLLEYDDKDGHAVIAYRSAEFDCDRAVAQPKLDDSGYMYVWCLITALVPKLWHNEIGGFDENMVSWEDWDYWIRMARNGRCFSHLRQPLVIYRFYTGGRREAGLRDSSNLVQYLTDKYNQSEAMACGCRKSSVPARSTVPTARSVPNPFIGQEKSEVATVNDADFLLCLYDHPNRGGHRVSGPVTGRDYGYRRGGDEFLVHKADIAGMPHIFRPSHKHSAPIAQAETPPPQRIRASEPPEMMRRVLDEQNGNGKVDDEDDAVIEDDNRAFDMQSIPGVTASVAYELQAGGVHTLSDLIALSAEQLQTFKGIGEKRAIAILEFATKRAALDG